MADYQYLEEDQDMSLTNDPDQEPVDTWGHEAEDEASYDEGWCLLVGTHCRAVFVAKGGNRICGNPTKCNRPGHRALLTPRGALIGYYKALTPLTKNSPVDGDPATFKDADTWDRELSESMVSREQDMAILAASPAYRAAVRRDSLQDEDDDRKPSAEYARLQEFTKDMEDRMEEAKADALAATPVRTNILTRAQNFRSSLFGGTPTVSPRHTAMLTTLERLEAAKQVETNRSQFQRNIRSVASMIGKPMKEDRTEQAKGIERAALIQEQIDFLAAQLTEEVQVQQEEEASVSELGTDENPTIHVEPHLAALESKIRLLTKARAAAEQQPASGPDPQVAAMMAKLARMEKVVAAFEAKENQRAVLQRKPSLNTTSPIAPHQGALVSGLQSRLAGLESRFLGAGQKAEAARPDPRVAAMEAKIERLSEAVALAEGARVPTHPQSSPNPYDTYVKELERKVAALEGRVEQPPRGQQDTRSTVWSGGTSHAPNHTAHLPDVSSQATARMAELEAELQHLKSGSPRGVRFQDSGGPQGHTNVSPTAGRILDDQRAPEGHISFLDIVPAKIDKSKGDEIHGHSIRVPLAVMTALCPKGMTSATRAMIAEAGLDVASLPGKFSASSNDAADMNDALANSLGRVLDIAGDHQGQRGARDLNFNSKRRNALASIKTEDQLELFRTDLEETSEEACESSENLMRNILTEYGMEDELVDYYINSSQFPTMIRLTMDSYRALIDHLIRLSAGPGGFKLAQMDLAHYAHKLGIRREGSQTRLEILFKNYCDLRDARRNKFIDSTLQQKKNAAFTAAAYASLLKPPPAPKVVGGDPQAPAASPACKRCSSRLHKGGIAACPFNKAEIPYAAARKLAAQCATAPNFMEAAKKAADEYMKENPAGGADKK